MLLLRFTELQKISEKGGLAHGASGCRVPAALLFEAGMCLSPVLLSKQSAPAFGPDTRVKSWQHRTILAHCVWSRKEEAGLGEDSQSLGGGGGAWRVSLVYSGNPMLQGAKSASGQMTNKESANSDNIYSFLLPQSIF